MKDNFKVIVVTETMFNKLYETAQIYFHDKLDEWVINGVTGMAIVRKDQRVPTTQQSLDGGSNEK